MKKGQINLSIATGMAMVSFIVAPLIVYYSAQSATNSRIAELDKKQSVTESQVLNFDKRLDKIDTRLNGIESKLGQLLTKNGIKSQ